MVIIQAKVRLELSKDLETLAQTRHIYSEHVLNEHDVIISSLSGLK